MKTEIREPLLDAIKGNDEPIGKKHPHASAGIVFLTYPLAIVVSIFVAFAIMNLFI